METFSNSLWPPLYVLLSIDLNYLFQARDSKQISNTDTVATHELLVFEVVGPEELHGRLEPFDALFDLFGVRLGQLQQLEHEGVHHRLLHARKDLCLY